MIDLTNSERKLPSREICYHYAIAMNFAQQFARDLRAILWTADYHGWIDEIAFSEEQRRRFKNFDGFIDQSTCGWLLAKLRETGTIKSKKCGRLSIKLVSTGIPSRIAFLPNTIMTSLTK